MFDNAVAERFSAVILRVSGMHCKTGKCTASRKKCRSHGYTLPCRSARTRGARALATVDDVEIVNRGCASKEF